MQMQWDLPAVVQSLLAPAAIAALVTFALRAVAKGKVESYFAHQLAAFKAQREQDLRTYQAELLRLADAAKFDYARRLADFNLFAEKRHAVYQELFRQYRVAYDAYDQYAERFHYASYFKKMDEAEVAALMTKKRVPAADRDDVVREWRANPDAGVAALHKALDPRYRQRARALFDKAQDYWLANNLYMSPQVITAVESLVRSLRDYVVFLDKSPSGVKPTDDAYMEDTRKFRKDLKTKFQQLREILRTELTLGDYDVT